MNPGAAIVLLTASSLTVLAGAIVAPSLPGLREAFAGQPGVDLLARLVLTVPALGVVVGAPFIGVLVDRVGRRKVLLAGLIVYGLCGPSGLWLPTLPLILAGRFVLGLGVAAVGTAATTLIADLTSGASRAKFLGIQAAFMGLGGLVFLTLGGWLADIAWRWPFAVYFVSLALVPVALITLEQDRPRPEESRIRGRLPRGVVLTCAMACLGMLLFYLLPVQLPFLLDQRLSAGGTEIGLTLGLMTVTSSTSSFLFIRVQRRLGSPRLLVLTFLAMAPGLVLIGWGSGWLGVLVGVAVFGVALGWLTPNLNLWTSELVPTDQRGRALGYLTTALFAGQFASPLAAAPLIGAGATLGQLFLIFAAVAAVVSSGLFAFRRA